MKFGRLQRDSFRTDQGAYSIVTLREHIDSQITLTDYEADLVVSFFGPENLHIGNVQTDRIRAAKTFKLYPSGKEIKLNIVYPKPEKTELRLYLSERAGFKPVGGHIWFLFIREGGIWIGEMDEAVWRKQADKIKMDESDDLYQEVVNEETDPIKIATLKERDMFQRDRNIALQRLKLSNYQCEYDSKHHLFLSRFTRTPYLEVHHLIPLGMQREFTDSLDNIHNVFCLCPTCHRAVHHATESHAQQILSSLAQKRPVLPRFSISLSDLYSLYAVETIT